MSMRSCSISSTASSNSSSKTRRCAGAGSFVTVPPGTMHDFRNPGTRPARWLGIATPGGLERYFQEVHYLDVLGALTEESVRELRLRFDTEEPVTIPAGHWSAAS